MKLSDEAMWKAVTDNDESCDGNFLYGVKTTGIFCRPSCRSKPPKRENVLFFRDEYEAVEVGFRPCKRCRPELLNRQLKPAEEVCMKVLEILLVEYADPFVLDGLTERVRVSPYHLQRLFKRNTGFTPKARLQQIRIEKAKALLAENTMNNTDICYTVGFQSLSRFYAAFRENEGISPREYRLNCLNEKTRSEVSENCV